MKIVVEINLGNEGMKTGWDVGWALRKVVSELEEEYGESDMANYLYAWIESGIQIRDPNGNVVGTYKQVSSTER
jgi:hypothetical protein